LDTSNCYFIAESEQTKDSHCQGIHSVGYILLLSCCVFIVCSLQSDSTGFSMYICAVADNYAFKVVRKFEKRSFSIFPTLWQFKPSARVLLAVHLPFSLCKPPNSVSFLSTLPALYQQMYSVIRKINILNPSFLLAFKTFPLGLLLYFCLCVGRS